LVVVKTLKYRGTDTHVKRKMEYVQQSSEGSVKSFSGSEESGEEFDGGLQNSPIGMCS
jgi:hypothetical protein